MKTRRYKDSRHSRSKGWGIDDRQHSRGTKFTQIRYYNPDKVVNQQSVNILLESLHIQRQLSLYTIVWFNILKFR
jgi:hypothetical protein